MKQPAWALSFGVFGALGLFMACGAGSGNYPGAGIGLGAAITGAGVNRAITGNCWAVCSPGYACDRARGTCMRAECVPACASGQQCVIEHDGRFRCIESAGTVQWGTVNNSGSVSSGAVSTSADASSDSPSDANSD